ncbi:type VII secretion protein EccB [Streptosporangium sp. KLBMP 9127]|nr:type VII secretion protein EccB [Streptosporangium sp. KLBMP 9127]
MQTRKDLYQAHRMMQQRLGMALLQGEPDLPESPMRRHNVGTFCAVLLAVLVLAIFGIWGLLSPGNATKLTDAGQLLVEEESGATYVYSQQDRRLLPVANYASARLLLDSQEITVRSVSAASLADFARGPAVGIVGAPDSLPTKDKLVHGPWSVCVVEGPDASGGRKPYVSLIAGTAVGGTAVGESAMVVDDGRQTWVLWADRRMRVNANGVRALNAQPRQVPPAWLNAIPAGPDFAAPTVPNRGRKVRAPSGQVTAVVGQVFTVPGVAGAAARWYVLLSDGLAPITVTQATLLLEEPASRRAYGRQAVRPIQIDAATANASPSRRAIAGGGLPATMPNVVTPAMSAPHCAVYANTRSGSARATLTYGSRVGIPAPNGTGSPEHFDQVLLPPGGGAVVGLLPAEGQQTAISNYFLLSDQGRRHAIPSLEQVQKLGYEAADVAPVPAHILNLIPEGPALDPVAARSPLRIGQ